ncbi:NPR2-domain-containing protein [Flagelloscypha sp. PMI_526]|nr:NPR2-domain-containing protein [Flagelloscypha sp. PMI_526]
MASGSFLPQILSVFYAQFDVQHGPVVVCQVPEGLITSAPNIASSAQPSVPPTPSAEFLPEAPILASRNSSLSLASSLDSPIIHSPSKRGTSRKSLFHFDDISKYIIPPSPLCGKLVRCHTQKHRVLGLPVELKGKYFRNYFRYNLCFVFERSADSSCYEPIVRKISRVLTTCEEESGFLSSQTALLSIQMACEQIYEDLNSYAETSITVDRFNSIELKSFPFFPNPSPVQDWMVPVALINLSKRIEENWDLTMVKVCQHLDGVNHVSRIAQLAECDLGLTRDAISHLLFYQVIMTVDIFQYSNMYTLRPSIQTLASQDHVKLECGPYVVIPGRRIPPWPKLLHLYSRMKAGITVFEWMKEFEVEAMGIDVRRFASFGVIKGFLRRVHRWPVYLPSPTPTHEPMEGSRPSDALRVFSFNTNSSSSATTASPSDLFLRGRTQSSQGVSPNIATSQLSPVLAAPPSATEARRTAAERVLEQLRGRDLQRSASLKSLAGKTGSPWLYHQPREDRETSEGYSTGSTGVEIQVNSPLSPGTGSMLAGRRESLLSFPQQLQTSATLKPIRPRVDRSPSAPHIFQQASAKPPYPPEFIVMLDGEHHSDELCSKFNIGWPVLEQWLNEAGGDTKAELGSQRSRGFGRIVIIYR